MNYSISERYNSTLIELKGNMMGGPEAETFKNDIHKLIEKGQQNVVVDLGGVKFINSSGLGILISGMTTLRNAGGDMRICRADKKIESLLMVTQLITVFKHFRTVEEAVDSFS